MANMIPPLNAWYFQDVVPLVFGDDISPLEMVAKLRWYVKTLIDAVNAINEDLSLVHNTINNIIQNLDNIKKQLEQIDTKLADLESRMQAAETDIDDLQSFTQQLRNELTQAQQDIVTNANNIAENLRKIEKNAADIVAINADLNSVHTELNTHTQQISEINNAIAEINREITDIHSHLDTVDQQINDLQTLTETHTAQIKTLEDRADATDETLTEHDQRISANADKINEVDDRLTPKVEKNEADILTLKGVTQSHTASIQTINSNITNINSDIADIQHDLENHNTRIDKNTDDIAELKTGETTINTTLENHETRITTLEGKVDNIPDDFSELVTQVQTNTTDISAIKTEQTEQDTKITANETAIAGLDTRMTSAEGSITALDNEQDTLNLAYEEQQRHITNIEAEQVTQNDRITALEEGGGSVPTDIQEQLDAIKTVNTRQDNDISTNTTNIAKNTTDIQTIKTKQDELEAEVVNNTGDIAEINSNKVNVMEKAAGSPYAGAFRYFGNFSNPYITSTYRPENSSIEGRNTFLLRGGDTKTADLYHDDYVNGKRNGFAFGDKLFMIYSADVDEHDNESNRQGVKMLLSTDNNSLNFDKDIHAPNIDTAISDINSVLNTVFYPAPSIKTIRSQGILCKEVNLSGSSFNFVSGVATSDLSEVDGTVLDSVWIILDVVSWHTSNVTQLVCNSSFLTQHYSSNKNQLKSRMIKVTSGDVTNDLVADISVANNGVVTITINSTSIGQGSLYKLFIYYEYTK